MFLTDKYHALLPLHSPKDHRKAPAPPATARAGTAVSRFDAALAARLASLLPLPASPLAALARLADLLAATLGDAVPALSATGAGQGDAASAAVAAHLDAGVALLDSCNAIAARVDRLRRRRLLSRLALHLLSSSPPSVQRARAALADRDAGACSSPPLPLPSLPFIDPPRSAGRQLTGAARVILGVNAVSSLAAAAAATILGGGGGKLESASFPLVVSGDLPWAEPFNAVSSQLAVLASANTSEVDAVDEAVGKLTAALDISTKSCEVAADEAVGKLASVLETTGEGEAVADGEAAVRAAAAQEVEKRTEELAARLDRLSDAVNGVFRAALRLRTAELGSFAAGPADKTRSSKTKK